MKKNSILTMIFALASAFTISASSCSMIGGAFGGTSSQESSIQEESSETSGTSEESKTSEKPETPETPDSSNTSDSSDTSDTSESPEVPEKPEDNALTVLTKGEVFPYIENIKNYLQAGAGAKVGDYYKTVATQCAPVQIKWQFEKTGARKFLVEYATKEDFSDAQSVEAGATKRSVDVYNLYKSTTYYVRVTALNAKQEALYTAKGEFYTTDLGPRFMKIDDVRNVRDLGGYKTSSGKTLVQGIAYRGGGLTVPPKGGQPNEISEDGKKYMSEVMGIKSEIDFRTANESGITLEQGSVIPGATLTYITINAYAYTFDYDDEYLQFFTMLADKNNYPFYIHCTGGADRTGSAIFLLHTMLGVSDLECLQGFELTSFSSYGLRDTQSSDSYKDSWDAFMAKLDTYAGNTKQEKVETWVRSIGVTQTQIDAIKAIFYGETAVEIKSNAPVAVSSVVEKKTAAQQYLEVLSGWAIQKKEN